MNTEDDEFQRIEREQTMRGVPDAIHHTDISETLEYITGWNDCRAAMLAAMLAEQPAQQEPVGEVSGHDWSTGLLYRDLEPGAPLYTAPQAQRKPLDVAEVEQILAQHNYEIHGDRARYIVRMTEAAHGIKENT